MTAVTNSMASKINVWRATVIAMVVGALAIITSDSAILVHAEDCDVEDASSMLDCDASMEGYKNMLGSLYSVARTTLQYAGFIAVFAGAILWFTAKRSSERAQTGVWLLIGGLVMIVFYFGFTAFVRVLHWVAAGEGGNVGDGT